MRWNFNDFNDFYRIDFGGRDCVVGMAQGVGISGRAWVCSLLQKNCQNILTI